MSTDERTLHDWFAVNVPTSEIQDISYRSLSRVAQEKLTGLKYPDKPTLDGPEMIKFQLAELDFICAVNAAIRYRMAHAMQIEKERQFMQFATK